ncbi:DUF3085 domain-containing protein [Serratia ureilytica]|uniref:DUF3085 domain-containing protein n=1 Tax=Serratia ureilytica TaxID=300181 RepID=UPI0020C131F6|nr:DUF3085 domain-containing protein [Serratia ureilytica]
MLYFNPAELRAVVAEVRANQCALVLAKDDGVNLMPAVGERNVTGRIKHLAYADGCHPEKDDAWYETSRRRRLWRGADAERQLYRANTVARP